MPRNEGALDQSAWKALVGLTSTDTISFYGVTPVAQRSAAILTATASLFAVTGASFVANTSTTLSGMFCLNSTLVSQMLDSFAEIRAWAVALGLHKGGA